MMKLKITLIYITTCFSVLSQGAVDGFFKSKNELDVAVSAGYGIAPEYYAGTNLIKYERNQTLLSVYGNYGLSNKWNLIASVPVINFQFQDASVYAKYKLIDKHTKRGNFSLFPSVGISFPIWKYETESGQAIGQRALTLQPLIVGQFKLTKGLFFQSQLRYNYSFEPVPSSFNGSVKIGYAASKFYIDAWFEYQYSFGEADYQGEVGYDSFRELATSFQRIGGVFYSTLSSKIGVFINGSFVLTGRNISKTVSIGAGIVFKLKT